jgi:hypothetical protein
MSIFIMISLKTVGTQFKHQLECMHQDRTRSCKVILRRVLRRKQKVDRQHRCVCADNSYDGTKT